MAEEFEESEVIFQENVEHEDSDDDACSNFDQPSSRNSKRKKIMKPNSTSKNLAAAAPVSIPENVSWLRYIDRSDFVGDDEEGEMVPPHIIVGRRRVAGRLMAFSVCTGNGRTLKGRDLSQVRNSVLRMTGFLET
ncbi:hypothetical protein ACP275_13G176800 [Erythranthe tilingii]